MVYISYVRYTRASGVCWWRCVAGREMLADGRDAGRVQYRVDDLHNHHGASLLRGCVDLWHPVRDYGSTVGSTDRTRPARAGARRDRRHCQGDDEPAKRREQ